MNKTGANMDEKRNIREFFVVKKTLENSCLEATIKAF
jgi:hypothetical protein